MIKSKNILLLHVSSDLYGASRVLLQVAIILKNNGYQPVVVISSCGTLKEALEEVGIPVYIRPLAILRRKYFNLPGLANRAQNYFQAKKALSQIIEQHQIDTIYTNTIGVLIGAVLAKRFGLRHIWHFHEIIKRPRFILRLVSNLAKSSNAEIIVVSNAVKKHWESYLSDLKISRIYNGFDFSYLDSSEKKPIHLKSEIDQLTIGMVARVHFWKGQTYFLDIAYELKKLGIRAKYLMVGDAFEGYEYLYDEINYKKTALELNENVIDLGFRQDIGHILDHLDLFILPSIQPDPLPTTVLEAMYKKKPVVATAHGGATEMVEEGVTGILIPWHDAQKAANKIKEMLTSESLNLMGEAGLERVNELFSENAFKRNILKLIGGIS